MAASRLQAITKQYTNASTCQQAMGTCTNGTYIIAVLTIEAVNVTATCSDSANGSYTQDGYSDTGTPANPTSKGRVYVFRVANTSTGTPTVTATLSGASYGQLQLYEISGLATSSVVDAVTNASFSGGHSASSLSITTTTANEAVLAFYCGDFSGGSGAADSGYTQAYAMVGQFNAYSYGESNMDVGAAGAKTITFGTNDFSVQNFGAVLIAYKLAGASGGSIAAVSRYQAMIRGIH